MAAEWQAREAHVAQLERDNNIMKQELKVAHAWEQQVKQMEQVKQLQEEQVKQLQEDLAAERWANAMEQEELAAAGRTIVDALKTKLQDAYRALLVVHRGEPERLMCKYVRDQTECEHVIKGGCRFLHVQPIPELVALAAKEIKAQQAAWRQMQDNGNPLPPEAERVGA